MRTRTLPLAVAVTLAVAPAQEVQPPPALPAAGTPEAMRLVDTGLAKMLALGRGMFRSVESRDIASFRQVGMPFAQNDVVVQGGWQQDLVWGDVDGAAFARHAGRTVARIGEAWKLRAHTLDARKPLPFVVDPELLFTVLHRVPPAARPVAHVEAGAIGGRRVTVLSLSLADEHAEDVAEAGVLPQVLDPASGGFFFFGGAGIELPRIDREVHVALHVDPDNGDVLQLGVKVYEKNPMFPGVAVAVGNAGEAEDAEEAEPEPPWRDGLPTRAAGSSESVLTWIVEFPKLGLADLPEFDDDTRQLLRLR